MAPPSESTIGTLTPGARALLPRRRNRLLLILPAVLSLPALWHLAVLAWAFLRQVPYRMDIEWMEGGALYHSYRFLHGLPIYGPPAQGFLPYPYPPLHYLLLSAAGGVFGLSYSTGRALSVLFFLLALGVLLREIHRAFGGGRTGALFALLGAGSAAAAFPVVSGWFALVRNDSMALALPILAAALLSEQRKISLLRSAAVASILVAAVFTKQTGIFFALWLGLFLLDTDRKGALRLALFSLGLGAVVLLWLQAATHGWFSTYVFLQAHHGLSTRRALSAMKRIFLFAPYLPLLGGVALLLLGKRGLSRRSVLWIGLLAAAFPAAVLPFAKYGGFDNNLMPVVLLTGPVMLLVCADVLRALKERPRAQAAARASVLLLAAAFLTAKIYDPRSFVPDAHHYRQAEKLIQDVRALPGGVMAFCHPFLPIQAGHATPQLHSWAYDDAVNGGLDRFRLGEYLLRGGARWVLLDGVESAYERESVLRFYRPAGSLPDTLRTLVPREWPVGPGRLYERKDPPLRRRVLFDFESSGFAGWSAGGSAFGDGPSLPLHTAGPAQVYGYDGDRFASSGQGGTEDGAGGELLSPPFTIDRSCLGFLIGGGASTRTRFELRIGGVPVLEASGKGDNVLSWIEWDLRPYSGKEARLALWDEDPQGHLLVDQVELFDPPPAADLPPSPKR